MSAASDTRAAIRHLLDGATGTLDEQAARIEHVKMPQADWRRLVVLMHHEVENLRRDGDAQWGRDCEWALARLRSSVDEQLDWLRRAHDRAPGDPR